MSEEASAAFRLLDFDDPAGGLLAYGIAGGDLDDAVLKPIWQRFDDAASSGSKLRIYAEMDGIPSVNPSMILDKLKRLGTIMSTVERMAIVGDAGWLDLYAKVIDPCHEAGHQALHDRAARGSSRLAARLARGRGMKLLA